MVGVARTERAGVIVCNVAKVPHSILICLNQHCGCCCRRLYHLRFTYFKVVPPSPLLGPRQLAGRPAGQSAELAEWAPSTKGWHMRRSAFDMPPSRILTARASPFFGHCTFLCFLCCLCFLMLTVLTVSYCVSLCLLSLLCLLHSWTYRLGKHRF